MADHDGGTAFYVGKLGLDLLEDVDQGAKWWAVVRPPGGDGALVVTCGADRPPRRVACLLHADDVVRDHAAMLAAGVRFEEASRHEP